MINNDLINNNYNKHKEELTGHRQNENSAMQISDCSYDSDFEEPYSSFLASLREIEAIFGLADTEKSFERNALTDSNPVNSADSPSPIQAAESCSQKSSESEKSTLRLHFPHGNRKASSSAGSEDDHGKKVLRTAAYCRVSTSHDPQESSLQAQKQHYEYLASLHDDWQLVSIYYEEGVSGTHAQGRPELERLLHDCQAGHIDLVLTKSISRFARNTVECIALTRWLLRQGVHIYFEKEGIHTGTMQSELFLSVLASLAESESRSISSNTRWSCQKRFQDGSFLSSVSPYGYQLSDGSYQFHEEELDVLQKVYDLNLQGYGCHLIARILNQKGIPRRNSTEPWDASVVKKLLENPFYCGDVLFQKTYTDDYFQRHYNHGDQSQVYIKDHHPGMIDHDTYRRTQEIKAMRRKQYKSPDTPQGRRGGSRSCLSGKIHCPCGCHYQRTTVNRADGRHFWVCRGHRLRTTHCQAGRLMEEDIQNIFTTLLNKLYFSEEQLLKPYLRALGKLQNTPPARAAGKTWPIGI